MTITNVLQPYVLKKCKMATVSAKVFKQHKKSRWNRLIQASETNWTIARPVGLNETQLLAKFFIDNMYTNTYIHKTAELNPIVH